MPPPTRSALRVALVLPEGPLPRHLAHLIETHAAWEHARLVALIVPPSEARRDVARRVANAIRDMWLRADRVVSRPPMDATVRIPVVRPADVPVIRLANDTRTGQSDPALDQLAVLQVDVVLDPGLCSLPAGLAEVARLGRWELTPERDGWPAAWEDLRGSRTTTRAWILVHDASGSRTIAQSVLRVSRLSLAQTHSSIRWASAHLAQRCLREVETGVDLARLASAATPATAGTISADEPRVARPCPPPPGPASTAILIARLAMRLAARAIERVVWRDEWFVALRHRSDDELPADLRAFRPVIAPGPGFLADPHLVDVDGSTLMFVEDHDGRRGRVSYVELGDDGPRGAPRVILEGPHHLSYPTVVRWGDDWYLVPENWEAGRLELYRATAFPRMWQHDRTLLDGVRAADPTIVRRNGRLWMFLTLTERGSDPWTELSLFSALDIIGPWRPHPANPIVSDVRRARPAGPLFELDGRLIRPAQDCSRRYGRRIILHRVDRLDEHGYAETPIATIEPHGLSGVVRTHTYSRSRHWEAVDGMERRIRGLRAVSRRRS